MTDKASSAKAVIGDFGSSVQLRSPQDTADFMIGTPGFTAPELLDGKKYGLAVDVWSLGAILYAMLTGELPFWSEDRRERKNRLLNEPLDLEKTATLRKLQFGKDSAAV